MAREDYYSLYWFFMMEMYDMSNKIKTNLKFKNYEN
jgi:hypothetical protein